jgi:hypothetical protein
VSYIRIDIDMMKRVISIVSILAMMNGVVLATGPLVNYAPGIPTSKSTGAGALNQAPLAFPLAGFKVDNAAMHQSTATTATTSSASAVATPPSSNVVVVKASESSVQADTDPNKPAKVIVSDVAPPSVIRIDANGGSASLSDPDSGTADVVQRLAEILLKASHNSDPSPSSSSIVSTINKSGSASLESSQDVFIVVRDKNGAISVVRSNQVTNMLSKFTCKFAFDYPKGMKLETIIPQGNTAVTKKASELIKPPPPPPPANKPPTPPPVEEKSEEEADAVIDAARELADSSAVVEEAPSLMADPAVADSTDQFTDMNTQTTQSSAGVVSMSVWTSVAAALCFVAL